MLNLRRALQHHKGYLILLITSYRWEVHAKHRPFSVLALELTRLHTLPVQSQSTLQKEQTKGVNDYSTTDQHLLLFYPQLHAIPARIQCHWQLCSCRIACIWPFCSSSSWVGVLVQLVTACVLSQADCRCTLAWKHMKDISLSGQLGKQSSSRAFEIEQPTRFWWSITII